VAQATDPGAEDDRSVDRERSLYVGACRIDLVRRAGTTRLLTDARLAGTVARALEAAGAPAPVSITIVLTDDEELRDLNRTHLDRDEPTDVLSFPMLAPETFPEHPGRSLPARARGSSDSGLSSSGSPAPSSAPGRVHLGDIAISVERASAQASAGRGGQTGDVRWSPADELRLLVTHGVLHVCGWDHAEPAEEAAMRGLEQRLLAEGR
jgi:probable rRNA maturation factor